MVGARWRSLAYRVELLGWGAFGEHIVHADDRSDRVCHLGPVAGDHDDASDPASAKGADGLGRIVADRVVEHQDAGGFVVDGHEEVMDPSRRARRRAVLAQAGGAVYAHPGGLAQRHTMVSHDAPDALAGHLFHRFRQHQLTLAVDGGVDHGVGQDVR